MASSSASMAAGAIHSRPSKRAAPSKLRGGHKMHYERRRPDPAPHDIPDGNNDISSVLHMRDQPPHEHTCYPQYY